MVGVNGAILARSLAAQMKQQASLPSHRPVAVIALNAAWNIANFRSGLVRALQGDGWEVVALAPADGHEDKVEKLGCRFVPIEMAPGGTNPFEDWRLYRDYLRLLRGIAPGAFLGFTIKPNVWGSLAAQKLGIPVINNIAGLGSAFIKPSWLTQIAKLLYRHGLRRSERVLFQNEDDRNYFVAHGLVDADRTDRIPGSGVDLQHFAKHPLPDDDTSIRVLMVARLLRDKGLREFAEAGRLLHANGIPVSLQLLGSADSNNPTAIPLQEVLAWQAEGCINYLGSCDDVRPWLAQAHAVVLPSYREGVPRTLLEAAASGRPLIATDVVGCRDAVRPGLNGMLVPPRDASALADAISAFAALPRQRRAEMGTASRALVETEFDERFVIDRYRSLLSALPGAPR